MDRKRLRKDAPLTTPPLTEAMAGDSLTTIGFDFEYASLQGLPTSTIPGIDTVQYEFAAVIPRVQGVPSMGIFAMVQGTLLSTAVLAFPSATFRLSLASGWSTAVQTKSSTVTPALAALESRMVFNLQLLLNADNVANADTTIVRGLLRTGVVQDFTDDVLTKLDSTTVLPHNKLQGTCLKQADIRLKLATRSSVIRIQQLADVFEPFTWSAAPIFFAANWTKSLLSLDCTGSFNTATIVYAKSQASVPYGVLPFIDAGAGTQIIMVLLRMAPGLLGASLVYLVQPLESLGCAPSKAYEGTWVGTFVFGQPAFSPVFISPQSALATPFGQMRMFCPTSIPTVAFLGLSKNMIYMYGTANGLAPPANPIPESYGFRPPELQNETEFLAEIRSSVESEGSWCVVTLT